MRPNRKTPGELPGVRDHGGTLGAFLPRLGHFSPRGAPMNSLRQSEGVFTERDVHEVDNKPEGAERSKYEPELFHHTPPYNAGLQDQPILVQPFAICVRFNFSPAFPQEVSNTSLEFLQNLRRGIAARQGLDFCPHPPTDGDFKTIRPPMQPMTGEGGRFCVSICLS